MKTKRNNKLPKRSDSVKSRQLKVHNHFLLSIILASVFLGFQTIETVSAFVIDDITIVNKIERNQILENLQLSLSNNTEFFIDLKLPDDSKDVVINNKASSGLNNSHSVDLDCESCFIDIEYKINNGVKALGNNNFEYLRIINFKESKTFMYEVTLPKGAILSESESDPVIVPEPEKIETNGKNLIITWKTDSPFFPQAYLVRYTFTGREEEKSSLILVIAIVLLILILLTLVILFLLYILKINKKQPKKDNSHYSIPHHVFSSDEKEVIKVLQKHKSDSKQTNQTFKPLTQKDIGKLLNWSKSKNSSVISGLERKKVIVREKFGRNYKVTLSDSQTLHLED